MAARSGFVILGRDENYVIGLWHNVFVTMWRDKVTLEGLRLTGLYHRQVDGRFVDGYCALAVLSMAALDMESDVRAEATRLSDNPGRNLKAIAQVILGTGFGAATARTVAAGLQLVRKAKAPSKIFNDVSTGIRWLEPYIAAAAPGPAPAPADLVSAISVAWGPK